MNILNKVTFKSLLKNKTRTIATIIGIILSAALMCTVTGAVSSFMGTLYDNAIYRAGYWNFYSYDMSAKDYDEVMKAPSIKETKYSQVLGYSNSLEQSDSANLRVLGTSGNFAEENMAVHITEGEYPVSNKEILLPMAYSYSGKIKIGDKITLDIGDRMLDGEIINNWGHEDGEYFEARETREYTVTGFYEAGSYHAAIVNYSDPPALTLADEGMPEEYSYDFYLIFKNPRMYDIHSDEFFYVPLQGFPNNTLYEALGRGGTFLVTVMIAAVAVILVGVGSVSLIYNAFSISVSERTKLFGLLSSVGATKRQIRRTVIAEALMVSLIGIPLGVAAGIGIVAGGIEVLTQAFGDVGASLGFDVPFTLHINGWALGAAVVISLLTVLISAWVPSKRATKISAIEAIHMTTEISDRQIKTSPVTEKLFGLSGVLASKYYKRSKKRYRTTIISLVFSIVLFITISGFSDIFMEAVFYQSYSYGYDVYAYLYDYPFSDDNTPDDLLETFENADVVTNAAYTAAPNDYGYHSKFRIRAEDASQRAQEKHWLLDLAYYETNTRSDWLFGSSNLLFVDDESFKELLKEYNLDEKVFMDPDEPLAVVVDGNRSFDSDTGRYITKKILDSDNNVLYGYYYDKSVRDEYDYWAWENESYDENGECTLYLYEHDNHGEMQTLAEIPVDSYVMKTGKVIYDYPYFVNDSYSNLTIIYPVSLAGKVYKEFADIVPNSYFFLSEDHAACTKAVETILGSNGNSVRDYAGEQQSARNVITAASIIMYIFVALIALISVTNVFNTITTNINLRRREFAMLKSIGMTSNGFNGMMNFECVLYGAKSLLYGLPISAVILVILNLLMTWGYDMSFRLPWLAIFITVAGVFAAVFVTMMYALNKVKKASPIEELKNENI